MIKRKLFSKQLPFLFCTRVGADPCVRPKAYSELFWADTWVCPYGGKGNRLLSVHLFI